MRDAPNSLNGNYGSYSDGSKVKIVDTDLRYSVLYSFFVLNADNSYTICYLLKDDSEKTLFCPHIFLALAGEL